MVGRDSLVSRGLGGDMVEVRGSALAQECWLQQDLPICEPCLPFPVVVVFPFGGNFHDVIRSMGVEAVFAYISPRRRSAG